MLAFLQNLFRSRADPHDTGGWAEEWAAVWLRRHRGFTVVARNWRNPRDHRDELDLVCRDGQVLVFVEVKARDEDAMVPGYFAVDRRKKRVLRRTAKAYLARLNPKPAAFRLDIVEIELPDGIPANKANLVVRHFENVPLFPKHFRG